MRVYEIVYIVHPELDEKALKETNDKVKDWITETGGEINKIDLWGKRKLAYPIRKQLEGQYILMDVKMEPEFVAQLERNMRLYEPIMRYLITLRN